VPYSTYVATGLVVVVITYFSIVVGELVPKRLGQTHPETLARLVARPINWLAIATKPFVRLLSISTHALLRLLGVKDNGQNAVTEDEIHAMLAEGTTAGVIESHEHAMVRNVFRLDDRQIGSLMVPRGDVIALDVDLPFEENLTRIEQSDHARFPVIQGSLEHVLGVVNARQWLSSALRDADRDLDKQPLAQPLYVPETLTGMELLDNFRLSDVHMAFVIDEYGEVQGIVTLQDLIEAITGEFRPRDPRTSWAVQREDGSWLLDGHIPVPELKDRLGLDGVPEEERGRSGKAGAWRSSTWMARPSTRCWPAERPIPPPTEIRRRREARGRRRDAARHGRAGGSGALLRASRLAAGWYGLPGRIFH
jgi:putative hemolysin